MSPIRPENRLRYPPDWPARRARILQRAKHRCEGCGVPNYALGYRDEAGVFVRAAGNQWQDAAGLGELAFADVAEYAKECNEFDGGYGPDEEPAIVIVLTIAHLDHQPENCADDNLRAWCQQCHNRHDAGSRRAGIRQRRDESVGQQGLLEEPECR